jgi:hypothetical protein
MSKLEKLIVRFLSYPNDFTWEELLKILNHFGYKELPTGKTGGSRRKFVDEQKHIISLHKPHPANVLKKYQIEDVIASLKETGKV